MAMAICSSALRVVCAARAPKVKAAGAGNVVTAGKKFANLGEAVDAGLVKVSGLFGPPHFFSFLFMTAFPEPFVAFF